ncbi:MAG: hypothetical protein PVF49_02865 [Anaerolineales bacterium]|jgi:hypothetical protein
MNKSRFVWGLVCLAIAAALTVANIKLPAEDLIFQIGDQNMPWVPPVVLAVVGVIMMALAFVGRQPADRGGQVEEVVVDPDRAALNKRLEAMAWGLFLILVGGFMFVPEQFIAGGWWSIAVGLVMLGLNLARYINGLRMSTFTTALGILSILSGILEILGLYDLDGAMLLIILGAYLIIKPALERRNLFGKAEQA